MDREIPRISIVASDATYLLWLDCKKFTEHTKEFAEFIRKKTGLYLSEGSQFGGNGKQFLRMNIACPRATILDGLDRLKRGCEAYAEEKQSRKQI